MQAHQIHSIHLSKHMRCTVELPHMSAGQMASSKPSLSPSSGTWVLQSMRMEKQALSEKAYLWVEMLHIVAVALAIVRHLRAATGCKQKHAHLWAETHT